MRRIVFALCLVFAAASSEACSRKPTSPREDPALSVFVPYLTRTLTPSAARTQFGAPERRDGQWAVDLQVPGRRRTDALAWLSGLCADRVRQARG